MRPRLSAAVLLLCVSSPLIAQKQYDPIPPVNPQRPPATARITGSVFCNDTNRPARGAMVMAFRIPENSPIQPTLGPVVRVATDGTYSLDHLRAGDYTVIALLPGYLSPLDEVPIAQEPASDAQMRDALTRNGTVSVRDGEIASMDITLTRGATLSGRVTYSDGAPATQTTIFIEDANAKAADKAPQNPNVGQVAFTVPTMNTGGILRTVFLSQSQGTNDEGYFRISGLRSGTYRIAAVLPSSGQSSDSNGIGIPYIVGATDPRSIRVYSDSTLHKNGAKTYELRACDQISGVEITIPVDAFHRVEGHLTTLDGRPIIVAALTLTDTSDDSFVLRSHPTRDGEFLFPEVPSGTYSLTIVGARLGTLPDNMSPESAILQNAESFADTTSSVVVKGSDITDLSIQLQNAPPAPNRPAAAPPSPTTSQ